MTMPTALEISRRASLKPLHQITAEIGLPEHLLESAGDNVAWVRIAALAELADRPKAKYPKLSTWW